MIKAVLAGRAPRGLASTPTAARGRSPAPEVIPDGLSLPETEKGMLVRALERSQGNQTQAARTLGITRDTLRYRMKKYNLQIGVCRTENAV